MLVLHTDHVQIGLATLHRGFGRNRDATLKSGLEL